MEEPKRLLDNGSLGGEARRLLESYGPTPGLPPNIEASVAARVAEGPTAASGAIGAKGVLLVLALLGVTAVWWGTRGEPVVPDRPVAAVSANDSHEERPAIVEDEATTEIATANAAVPIEADTPPALEPNTVARASDEAARRPKPKDVQRPREARAPPAPAPDPGGLAEELRILDAGKRALEEDPSVTMRHVQDHRRRFVNGQLADLRDFLEIRALERLGDTARAKAKTDRFRATHPGSALVKELRSTP